MILFINLISLLVDTLINILQAVMTVAWEVLTWDVPLRAQPTQCRASRDSTVALRRSWLMWTTRMKSSPEGTLVDSKVFKYHFYLRAERKVPLVKNTVICFAVYKIEHVFKTLSKTIAYVMSCKYFLIIIFTTIQRCWDFTVQRRGSGSAGRAWCIFAVRC